MADILEILKKIHSSTDTQTAGKPDFIIAGLGNPDGKYTFTRHNAGFLALDYISEKCGCPVKNLKFKSLNGTTTIGSHRVMLMKPQTYMNLSGQAIREAVEFYKIPMDHVIVLVDDIYLAPGRMRVRKNGSSGGHKGLRSIEVECGSTEYPRIRIGVGEKPNPEYPLAEWVVGRIPKEDESKIFSVLETIYDALPLILDGKFEDAMGKCNGVRF